MNIKGLFDTLKRCKFIVITHRNEYKPEFNGGYYLKQKGREILHIGGWKQYRRKISRQNKYEGWKIFWFWPSVGITIIATSIAMWKVYHESDTQDLINMQAKRIDSIQSAISVHVTPYHNSTTKLPDTTTKVR